MTEEQTKPKCIAVVRIRGTISAQREARDTLQMLHLARTNHAVLVESSPSMMGMVKSVQSYVTWGEPSIDTIRLLLSKRGRVAGNKKLTDEYTQKVRHESLEELVKSVFECKVQYWKLPEIQPFFRLHPPSKGFKGKIKKAHRSGGELGYRGEGINDLVTRML